MAHSSNQAQPESGVITTFHIRAAVHATPTSSNTKDILRLILLLIFIPLFFLNTNVDKNSEIFTPAE